MNVKIVIIIKEKMLKYFKQYLKNWYKIEKENKIIIDNTKYIPTYNNNNNIVYYKKI